MTSYMQTASAASNGLKELRHCCLRSAYTYPSTMLMKTVEKLRSDMKADDFKKPCFVKTAESLKDYPVLRNKHGDIMPEIALVGRSNVGKSSLLNHLFQSPKMVKTSATPGKTQAINFFTVNHELAFVDLPGYGYAKAPLSVRKKWGPMIQEYLQSRESLQLILFLFDIRRKPNEEDRLLLEWIAQAEKAMILVLTKADKLNQSERHVASQEIVKGFHAGNIHHVSYSVTKNLGRINLIRMLLDALQNSDDDESN